MYEGKKIFIVMSHGLIREQIVSFLAEKEYEVYSIHNHESLDSLIARYDSHIFYVNIDGSLAETEWKKRISGHLQRRPHLQIGILSGRFRDKSMIDRFALDTGVTCGVICLRQGNRECIKNLMRMLEVTNARGRRKYIRYQCGKGSNATLNLCHGNVYHRARIRDISSVGLSCEFDTPPVFRPHELIKDVQLNLGGILITTDCVIMGNRTGEGIITYVLLYRFSQDRMVQEKKRIRSFINRSLQKDLERNLA